MTTPVPGTPASRTVRVLGIDTSLRSTGFGVIEARGSALQLVEQGCIAMAARHPLSACLATLHRRLTEIIVRTGPHVAALEGVFFCKNVRTAVILGEARGAVIAACAGQELPLFEYPPRSVKQALVGFGAADKSQVRKMVMSILGLHQEPQEDAGDALAIAICHLHSLTPYAPLAPKAI